MTLNIIANMLRARGFSVFVKMEPSQTARISSLRLLPKGSEKIGGSSILVFCEGAQFTDGASRFPQCQFLVCCEGETLPPGVMEAEACALFVFSVKDGAEVFNSAQQVEMTVRKWRASLERLMVQNAPLQALIDISEPHFAHPILVTNRSVKPVAYTKNIPSASPLLQELQETGKLPLPLVGEMSRIDSQLKKQGLPQMAYYKGESRTAGAVLSRFFEPNPIGVNLACLYGEDGPLGEHERDLFAYLCDVIEAYAKSFEGQVEENLERDIYFITDILDGNMDREELFNRSSLITLPLASKYRLYCIGFEQEDALKANHIADLLYGQRPYCKSFSYQGRALLLAEEKKPELHYSIMYWLKPQLERYDAICGVSSIFTELVRVKDAFMQASSAIELGKVLDPRERIYPYYVYYVYHLLTCGERELGWDQLYDNRLDRIMENDQLKGSDNLRLLEVYLNCDRSVSETAGVMNLHRNSVLYRLERIRDALGTDLNDPEDRLRLLISFKALRLKAASEGREGDGEGES